ncbi:MAG: metallophosphoesterase [gamma proteobacterium symbiont of Bathyaustriella thionipta]|nr:metallophosphoesterase [gamma proteobacterium symbiont of Bathyaustriella thionipta]MCU7950435.1 metallophosphoesterase [gamma proteobacterium symbiont of Bathyaustriella thionipta]MCU7953417.1 metallophosphoesterase [gamma proteobacterium symbiont of Bathyaustriella thionipta]MCU7956941.1 metallophosphoesterase [gamma proteobacterium symbiont of Bathyaustriella thionipta]MCU7966971.1 metallophosphoesterase [gamma proteobacterium symbiont of Bathyaustriella thionipta]
MKIKYFLKNNKGRDFVCGDLHGCFQLLEEKLSEVSFNTLHDRLFCVGDIIDRGVDSIKALEYLEKSWFYCVRGNHEQMLLDWIMEDMLTFRVDAFRFHIRNGGIWIADYLGVHIQTLADDIDSDELITEKYPALNHWADAIKKLPYAIEIKSKKKKIGIIHAEIPDTVKWPSLEAELNKTSVLYSILYSRKYIKSEKRKKYRINGVDEIYCGHTIVNSPQKKGNINYIDTGAYSDHHLTLIELD